MRGNLKKLFNTLEKAEEVFGEYFDGATIEAFTYSDGGNDKDIVIHIISKASPEISVDKLDIFTEWWVDNIIKNVVICVRPI